MEHWKYSHGIKYHFLSLWYDSTWDWTPVSRTIGEHFFFFFFFFLRGSELGFLEPQTVEFAFWVEILRTILKGLNRNKWDAKTLFLMNIWKNG